VDQTRFQEAQQAYEAGDFRTAAKGFLAAAGRTPDGNGVAYHMAGNALMRLRRYQDAVTVYGHALRDELYEKRGAVWANLGKAYAELGEYAEAVKAYESALDEQDYTTQYKAYQGMAGALLERGRVEDAAVAYRKAALDAGNPDPGKALVNLGLCFMALGRPADAVEAYQAALGFDTYEGRGKALANLGLAYCALGRYDDAVRSFEKAVGLHGHQLSPAAAAAYETARANADPGVTSSSSVVEFAPAVEAAEHEQVDGWLTGEIPSADLPLAQVTGAWDADAASAEVSAVEPAPADPFAAATHDVVAPSSTSDMAPIGDEAAVADFFSVTEAELKERDKEARRAERHERGPGAIWRKVAVIVAGILLVIAALAAAYAMGFGWPTQNQSVYGMLNAYQSGAAVDSYWVAVPSKDVSKEMAKIPPIKSFEVDAVDRGATLSTVHVTVTPKNGAPLSYVITLSREGAGWKVNGVENDWHQPGS